MVRDTARRFVEDEYLPLVTEAFREGRFPMQVVPRLAELGFFGSTLPEEYGCANLGHVAYALINHELERGDSGLRSFASVQARPVMYPVFTFGPEHQRRAWLPQLATARAMCRFGLPAPGFAA